MILEPTKSCVRDRNDTTVPERHSNRENHWIDPNSCLSDLSDSVESAECISIYEELD